MNQYLSNTMPKLSEHEIKCKGSYTISYFDLNAQSMVAAKYCSLYMFCHLTGLENSQKNRDLVCRKLADRDFFQLSDKDNPRRKVTIYK